MRGKAPYVVTFDIGTSSVRAQLYDATGQVVPGYTEAQEHQVVATPDGGNQLDAAALVEETLGCLERLVRREGFPTNEVAGVAGCTFWHSLVAVDLETERPLSPVFLWGDTRSRNEIKGLAQLLDEEALHQRTGCFLHTSYLPAKIAWLYAHYPEYRSAQVGLMSMAEYLYLRLFGRRVASYSIASGSGLMDQAKLVWDREISRVLGIIDGQLSSLVDKDEPCRGLRSEYTQRLAGLADLPWFPPVGDGAADNIGSGCTSPQDVALMIGTSGATRVLATDPLVEIPQGIWFYRVDGKRYVVGGSLSNGGNLLQWFSQLLGAGSFPEVMPKVAEVAPDGHGLTVLPFLAGERCPGWNPHAVGTVTGLRMHTRPEEIIRAACEGVAYRFELIHQRLQQILPADYRVYSTGGGLHRYPFWNQIIADVLGRKVELSEAREASSRGAAVLALESLGIINDISQIRPEVRETFVPNPQRHEIYQTGLARQSRFYQVIRQFQEEEAGMNHG